MRHPEPQLRLLFALQRQHNGLSSHRDDLQLVLFSLQVLLLVDHTAAQQVHVQLRCLLLGALIALNGAKCRSYETFESEANALMTFTMLE